MYTEGSKDNIKVGCAKVFDNHSKPVRVRDGSSCLFTAKPKAIDLA